MTVVLGALSALLAVVLPAAASGEELCAASCAADEATGREVCKFHATVDLYAGELGYYGFEECGDATNPTLGLEVGRTYEFVQRDVSNYYHPLGFAYFPDGAHADANELEPGVGPPGSMSGICFMNNACPAPMYYIDGVYQGTYSNNADLRNVTAGEDDFGLDAYEPLFFHPLPDWIGYGTFSVFLKFDEDTDYQQDIFYFCHIHQFMTGRIKLLKDGKPLNDGADSPEIEYKYDEPTGLDEECGSFGLDSFQLPNAKCPEKFVCDVPEDNMELAQFSSCIDSMNCAMTAGMTSSLNGSESEKALFMHQMIPHHQNAVNMAKALLKTGKIECDDLTDEESDQANNCALQVILREIINVQNAQIQSMQGLLESGGYPEENDCQVTMSGPGMARKLVKAERAVPRPAAPDQEARLLEGSLCEASCTTDEATGNEVCKFTAKVDLFEGELGYYGFEECGDVTNPTLGLEVGKTYEFVQQDRSNYYHPLGFAYFPDGAHAAADELEPGIAPPGSTSTCADSMTCPAPMYYIENVYQGTYSNNADLQNVTIDEDNFGLDEYEPLFFYPLPEWIGYGTFSVFLKFDEDTDYKEDIFYFCHIHQFMTGRIKLLKDGQPLNSGADSPEIDYKYEESVGIDKECGTFGLDDFQLPNAQCPEKFVCDVPSDNADLAQFSDCIDSMNCAMMAGMTSSLKGSESEVALFLHQMIPHHQNAVNMAKALLKTGKIDCDDLTDEDGPQADDCALEVILREIINNQNAQIQAMRGLLESEGYPEENDCRVIMNYVAVSTPAPVLSLVAPPRPAPIPTPVTDTSEDSAFYQSGYSNSSSFSLALKGVFLATGSLSVYLMLS